MKSQLHSLRRIPSACVALGSALAFTSANAATVFNVNIDYANQSRTGLVGPAGGAGETWAQSITGTHGDQPWTQTSIPDSTGATTGVSYTVGSNNQFRQNQTATNEVMQSALFWNSGSATTLTITGLTPSSTFDLYIAGFSSSFPTSVNWTTSNTTSTAGTKNYTNTGETVNWVQGDNYVLFEDVVVDGTGTIVMSGTKVSAYGFISGFQLVQVPEPSSCVIGAMFVSLGLIRRRR